MSFTKWVRREVVELGRFNYWEVTFSIWKDGRNYDVYHSKLGEEDLNIVVVEGTSDHGDGYKRKVFYFDTFRGKSSGECRTEEEAQPFFDRIRATVCRKNRVPGRDLSYTIKRAVENAMSSE